MKARLLALAVAIMTHVGFADGGHETNPTPGSEKAARKVILPSLDFRDADIKDVIPYLNEIIKRQAPDEFKINMGLIDSQPVKANNVTISLRNILLYDALNLIAEKANLKVEYQEKAIMLRPCKTGEGPGNLSSNAGRSVGKHKSVSTALPASKKAARKTHIPSLDFRDADIDDVVPFLSMTARRLDRDGIGVNIVYIGPQRVKEHRITMSIRMMNLDKILDRITDMGKLSVEYQENVIVLRPRQ